MCECVGVCLWVCEREREGGGRFRNKMFTYYNLIYIVSNVQTGSSMDEHLDNFYMTISTSTDQRCSPSLNNM